MTILWAISCYYPSLITLCHDETCYMQGISKTCKQSRTEGAFFIWPYLSRSFASIMETAQYVTHWRTLWWKFERYWPSSPQSISETTWGKTCVNWNWNQQAYYKKRFGRIVAGKTTNIGLSHNSQTIKMGTSHTSKTKEEQWILGKNITIDKLCPGFVSSNLLPYTFYLIVPQALAKTNPLSFFTA